MDSKYDEIINLEHHVSKTRPQMPMSDRAAQFSPFAALTGYDDAIRESGRLTDGRTEFEENYLDALNMKFRLLLEHLDDLPEIRVTYFRPDDLKSGGAYLDVVGTVKKIDEYERLMVMTDGTKLPLDDIVDISGDIFISLEQI